MQQDLGTVCEWGAWSVRTCGAAPCKAVTSRVASFAGYEGVSVELPAKLITGGKGHKG